MIGRHAAPGARDGAALEPIAVARSIVPARVTLGDLVDAIVANTSVELALGLGGLAVGLDTSVPRQEVLDLRLALRLGRAHVREGVLHTDGIARVLAVGDQAVIHVRAQERQGRACRTIILNTLALATQLSHEAAVGDRVVWMKYGREGVVEAEVPPGVFIVFFDKGGFRETVRAEELRVL